jgi:transposase
LLVGYCLGIRSERRLCEEVHLNLAYRWFCRIGLEGKVPDHSTFSKNRHGRFRESDTFRHVFVRVTGSASSSLWNVREMTKIVEHEIHSIVLSCTRARRQMLAVLPATKPTLH